MAITWDVLLDDKVLVTFDDEAPAKAVTDILNGGSLHGVPGDPAAYRDARAARYKDPKRKATVRATHSQPKNEE